MKNEKNTAVQIETTPATASLVPQSKGDSHCRWTLKISSCPLKEKGIQLESQYGFGELIPVLLAILLGDYAEAKILYTEANFSMPPYFLHIVIDTRILTDTPQAVEKFRQGFRTALAKFDEGLKVNKNLWAFPEQEAADD